MDGSRSALPWRLTLYAFLCSIEKRKEGWTAYNVMRAYIEAASKAHERFNVITEVMFLDALRRARELDEEFEKTGKLVGLCESDLSQGPERA